MWPLRQSTASQRVQLGPFLGSDDGDTAKTGLTIANTDIRLAKSGAAYAAKNSGGATHDAGGNYYATLNDTDTDTVGPMRVYVHVATALAVWLDCMVYPAAVYDALFADGAAGYQVPIWSSEGATVNLSGTNVATVGSVTAMGTATGLAVSQAGTAQGGSSTTITLNTNASAVDDFYKHQTVRLTSGTGLWQSRVITAYNGTTKVAAVNRAWAVAPVAGATYVVLPGEVAAGAIAAAAGADIAAALLDLADAIEVGITLRKAIRAIAAGAAGDVTGAGTAAEAFKAIGNNGTTRVTPNADDSGNRTGVTLNL